MKLVIAEKPSVGVSIAKVLNANDRKNGYYEGSGSISNIKLGWHDIG